jgi:outer membrane protein OmpA-like peptidoglycan-associated protein
MTIAAETAVAAVRRGLWRSMKLLTQIVCALTLATSASSAAFAVSPFKPFGAASEISGLPTVKVSTASQRLSVILADQGYSEIRFTSQAPPIYVARACKDGVLYEVTMNRTGEIRAATSFGRCSVPSEEGGAVDHLPEEAPKLPSLREISADLSQRGFKYVEFVETRPPHYTAEACRNDMRHRLTINRGGVIVGHERLGPCDSNQAQQLPDNAISASDVQDSLTKMGYRQLVFIDARPPTFVVQGCQDGKKLALRVNSEGVVTRTTEIGSCNGGGLIEVVDRPPNMDREGIEDILLSRGYLNVRNVKMGRRAVTALACKGNRNYRVTLDVRQGHIQSREYLGNCPSKFRTFDRLGVRRVLHTLGYRKIQLEEGRRNFLARACFNVREYALRIKSTGEIDFRKAVGWCDAMRDREVEVLPPNRIPDEEIAETFEIPPSVCQQYLDWQQFKSPILFEVDSARVSRDSHALLRRVARNLDRCRNAVLRIEGHTDDTGNRGANRELSEKRAEAVFEFLARNGVGQDRVQAAGYGERHPIVSNDSMEMRERNRRIELILEWDDRGGSQ